MRASVRSPQRPIRPCPDLLQNHSRDIFANCSRTAGGDNPDYGDAYNVLQCEGGKYCCRGVNDPETCCVSDWTDTDRIDGTILPIQVGSPASYDTLAPLCSFNAATATISTTRIEIVSTSITNTMTVSATKYANISISLTKTVEVTHTATQTVNCPQCEMEKANVTKEVARIAHDKRAATIGLSVAFGLASAAAIFFALWVLMLKHNPVDENAGRVFPNAEPYTAENWNSDIPRLPGYGSATASRVGGHY
jgi:hypothetical protein